MIKILFICHGNICRSPMGEYILKDMVQKAGLESEFEIDSAAVSREEIGNPVYPPVRQLLASKGISTKGKTARRIRKDDYGTYDLIIGMDSANMRNLRYFFDDREGKIHSLLSYAGSSRDISDPWYTDDFETCYSDVLEGVTALIKSLENAE